MKSVSVLLSQLAAPMRERRVRVLFVLLALFVVLVAGYSWAFHELMADEGRSYSWPSSVYWTLVTMTTVGFGDITFESDAGRIFSVVVLLSGSVFLLVLLPFTFIQFVFAPWMQRHEAERAPRKLPADRRGHLVLTSLGAMEEALIARARRAGVPYVVVEPDLAEALRRHDAGYEVMVGALDDPATYHNARVEAAALVATSRSDTANTNIVFTVQEISSSVPIVSTADKEASVDILRLAGAERVLRLGEMLGRAMARRILSPDARSHVIGRLAGLEVAEAAVTGTELVGRTVGDAGLADRVGVNVLGVHDRGRFTVAGADTTLSASSVLVLAGTPAQLAAYDEAFGQGPRSERPVVILGGGRVGRAVGRALAEMGVEHRIVEQQADRVRDRAHTVVGDAAELEVLEAAGFHDAAAVVVTTHDDDVNVYLTLYCRKLRPDLQIIARATSSRNVSTLYRAGADGVASYASIGAAAIWNHFRPDDLLVVDEHIDLFRTPVPRSLAGRTLAEANVRSTTGCNVVAVVEGDTTVAQPSPHRTLPRDGELVLIGDDDDLARFAERFG